MAPMLQLAVLALGLAFPSSQSPITIDNIEPGEMVRYPLLILRGRVDVGGIRVGLNANNLNRFPAFRNRYTAICELKPGVNFVILQAGENTVRQRVDYKPMKTPYKVAAVWAVAADENETTTPKGVIERGEYRAKFDLALKLMQSMTAEAMHDAGYGRKTFPLELGANGRVAVHVVRSPKTGDELRAMDGNAIWSHFNDRIHRDLPDETYRWATLMEFTGYDAGAKKGLGHLALGGGQLAAFGAGSMAYWPSRVSTIAKAFTNRAPVDPAATFDDSNGRDTAWANAATGIGAFLHELGHTFGLPHSPDPTSVMSRGFDFFNRAFVSYEAPYRDQPDERQVLSSMVPKWDPFFAARLNWSPFFQPDGNQFRTFSTAAPPSVQVNKARDEVTITSSWPLKVTGAERDDTPAEFSVISDNATKEVRLSRATLRQKMGDKPYRIVAVDAMGNQTVVDDQP